MKNNQDLYQDITNHNRPKVISINGKDTKETLLKRLADKRTNLSRKYLNMLQKAEKKFSERMEKLEENTEKPYRNLLTERLTEEAICEVTHYAFWHEWSREQRVHIWKNVRTYVASLSIDEVIDRLL